DLEWPLYVDSSRRLRAIALTPRRLPDGSDDRVSERSPIRAETNDYPVVDGMTAAEHPYLVASFRDWRRVTKFPALDSADTWSALPPVALRLLARHQDDAAYSRSTARLSSCLP